MKNAELATLLREIAQYLEMEDVPFKPRAYERAALSIENLAEDITEVYAQGGRKAIEAIPGVGAHIAEKIEEFIKKGSIAYYAKLKRKTPVNLAEITRVEGVGPKVARALYRKLKITNLKELEEAAREGKIRKLTGFGVRSEQKILKGIEFLKSDGGRFVLGLVEPYVERIANAVKEAPTVTRCMVVGSYRRRKETIGDIDILAIARKPVEAMKALISMPEVAHVYGQGTTKANIRLRNGMDADLRIVPERSWGAALNYFTGSKAHNIALRRIALARKWKLSEYGLFRGTRYIGGRTEEELYKLLGLRYIEPELRENEDEIEAAKENRLPRLIGYNDLKGDLQIQTDWTDGADSIEHMAEAGRAMGLEYIAITDHTRSLAMTRGADEKKLRLQMKAIDALNMRYRARGARFTVLKGAEVNILKDGSLDIDDATLQQLDVVGIAVHSHFSMSRSEMTARITKAMRHPHTHILFHPTGRIINKRAAYEVDMEALIAAARITGTLLEIDAYPERLDLKDEFIRRAVKRGVKLTIDSDAHAASHIDFLRYGIAQARRGWAEKKDIANTLPLKEFLKLLKHR